MMKKIFSLFLLVLILLWARAVFPINDWTEYTAVVDTAEDRAGSFIIERFEWCPAAVDNDLIIYDDSNSIIWKVRATAAAPNCESYAIEKLEFYPSRPFRGLNIHTIDGGILYIYRTERSSL